MVPQPEFTGGTGIPGATVTCSHSCEDAVPKVTDHEGRVTVRGVLPLTLQAEKPEYIGIRQTVVSDS